MAVVTLAELKEEAREERTAHNLPTVDARITERLINRLVSNFHDRFTQRETEFYSRAATVSVNSDGIGYLPFEFANFRHDRSVVRMDGVPLEYLSYSDIDRDSGWLQDGLSQPAAGTAEYYLPAPPRDDSGKYSTGTVTIANGSTALTSSADWSGNVANNDYLRVVDPTNSLYVREIKISSVGTTSHTLARSWPETALSAASYTINPGQRAFQTYPKAATSTNFRVRYDRRPEPVYDDSDIPDLPYGTAFDALIRLMRINIARIDNNELRSDLIIFRERRADALLDDAVLKSAVASAAPRARGRPRLRAGLRARGRG